MMSFYFPCVTTYTEKIKENFRPTLVMRRQEQVLEMLMDWSDPRSCLILWCQDGLRCQNYVSLSCSIVTQDIDLIRAFSITSRRPPPPHSKIKLKKTLNMTRLN